jgi:nucleotide-binding universal stress UspA family protein
MFMTTSQFQRILCPTDFSPFSSQALRHAVALSRVFGSRLKIIHVIPRLFPGGESLYASAPWLTAPEVRQRVDAEMRVFLDPLRVARVNHEIEIREGEPWREVVAVADDMQADLVVLGTHGRGGLDRLFLGSVAEKLVRRLPCPVFSVSHEEGRTWAAPGLITRIVCATDFSPMANGAFHLATGLAEKFRAELTLLHVVESLPDAFDPTFAPTITVGPLREDLEAAALARLRLMVAEAGPTRTRTETRVAFGRAYREILHCAATERADVVVVGAQGHGVFEHLFSGSNAQHVIRGATCPVLTVRPLAPRSGEAGETGLTLSSTPAGADR